jgi:hypothetical protein
MVQPRANTAREAFQKTRFVLRSIAAPKNQASTLTLSDAVLVIFLAAMRLDSAAPVYFTLLAAKRDEWED